MKRLAIFLLTFASTPAYGQPMFVVTGQPEPSIAVSYADLDLTHSRGIERLRSRVRSAARTLCLDANRDPLEFETKQRKCFFTAIAAANGEINKVVARQSTGPRVADATDTIIVTRR